MEVREWFNREYDCKGEYAQRRYPSEELVKFIYHYWPVKEDREGLIALDIGCGNGRNTKMMADEGIDVVGIDISKKAVDICKDSGLTAYEGDILNFQFAIKFDIIVDCFSMYTKPVDKWLMAMSNCKRLLNPGGKMFIYEPLYGNYPGNDYEFRFFESDDMAVLDGFKPDFLQHISYSDMDNKKNDKGFLVAYLCLS